MAKLVVDRRSAGNTLDEGLGELPGRGPAAQIAGSGLFDVEHLVDAFLQMLP